MKTYQSVLAWHNARKQMSVMAEVQAAFDDLFSAPGFVGCGPFTLLPDIDETVERAGRREHERHATMRRQSRERDSEPLTAEQEAEKASFMLAYAADVSANRPIRFARRTL